MFSRPIAITIGLVAPLLGIAACAERDNDLINAQVAAIDAAFRPFDRSTSPGCAVAVYQDGQIRFAKGYGMADLERNVPIRPHTMFDLGSTSKQFASASILLLAQDGKLALTDDVRKYIPELPEYPDGPITVDHLIRHTSGIRDYIGLMILGGFRTNDVTDDADALAAIVRQRNLNFAPGSQWLYSNSGYFLMSLIVERVSGKNLKDFSQERIFTPLGMHQTHFRNSHVALVPDRALAYEEVDSAQYVLDVANWEQTGDGQVQSSVVELARWDGNFADPKVGGPALLEGLTEVGSLNDGTAHTYARGLRVDKYRGLERVSHGGSWGGYRAMYARFPEYRTGVAITCNVSSANTSQLLDAVTDAVLREALAPRQADSASAGAQEAVLGAAASRYLGSYYSSQHESVLTLALRNDTLVASTNGGPGTPVRGTGPSRLAVRNSTLLVPEDAHPAPQLRLTTGEDDRGAYDRVPTTAVGAAQLAGYAGTYRSPELATTWVLSVEGDSLVSKPRGLGALTFAPAFVDAFTSRGNLVRFTRSGGRVDGFDVSAGRMLRIRFERR
ncbi:MAG: serine hydrolase domain-containing protein [Gemmatimonadales bacterium]